MHEPLALSRHSLFLSRGGLIPASGWTADRFGPRDRVRDRGGVSCGVDRLRGVWFRLRFRDPPHLRAWRAMLTPVGRLVLLRSIDKERTGHAWRGQPCRADRAGDRTPLGASSHYSLARIFLDHHSGSGSSVSSWR